MKIRLGYCDEVGSKGMTLHRQNSDCVNWSFQYEWSDEECGDATRVVPANVDTSVSDVRGDSAR